MISAAFKHRLGKWGIQHHHDLAPVLTNREGGATPQRFAEDLEIPTADRAKQHVESERASGNMNWGAILVEEVAEAVEQAALQNPEELQKELAQVAAVCIAWIDDIHLRNRVIA